MRDKEDSCEVGQSQNGIHKGHVVFVVLSGGRLVHHQDLAVHGQDGPDANPLLLSEAEAQRWVLFQPL